MKQSLKQLLCILGISILTIFLISCAHRGVNVGVGVGVGVELYSAEDHSLDHR